jgi:ABC-type nitrate/sulfonate/bicarbonate transport system substrate-binding protein
MVFSIAGCGGGSSGSADGSAGSGKGAPLIFAWNSTPDPSGLPILMAIDAMKADGYDITTQQTQSDSVSFQLMSANRLQLTFTNLADGAAPVAQGAPLKAVMGVDANATTWVSGADYPNCADLNGRPVGIYAPHEGYTLIQEAYFAKECPGVEPNLVVIPDSTLRAQALAAGKIDGSVLGTSDAYQLVEKYPDHHFNTVAMGPELAGAGDSYIWTNTTTIKDNAEGLQAFLAAVLKSVRQIYAEPDKLPDLVNKYFDATQLSVTQEYAKTKLWHDDGSLGGVDPTLKLFDVKGSYDQIVDEAPLQHALSEIGSTPP